MPPATPPSRRPVTWLRWLGWSALALNALDITTSLVPSFIDHLYPPPPRSTLGWVVQGALLVPLLVGILRRVPAWLLAWRRLPVPRVARWVLTIWLLVGLGHVALRTENYPFSNIGMFSSAVPPALAEREVAARTTWLVRRGEAVEPLSLLNEGSPFTARFELDFDYKAGWLMRMHAHNSSRALAEVVRRLRAAGVTAARRARVGVDLRTGRLVRRAP